MSRIAFRGLAAGLCALLPALAARASVTDDVALEQALKTIASDTGVSVPGASRGATSGLASLLAKLEQRYAARRLEFAAVARRRLPAKAAERLAQTQAAHEAGQGQSLCHYSQPSYRQTGAESRRTGE